MPTSCSPIGKNIWVNGGASLDINAIMKTPHALIFDVDGTLAETERDGHLPAFNHAFKQAGLNWHWSTEQYGALLAITGGKERMRYFAATHDPMTAKRQDFEALIQTLHQIKTVEYVRLVDEGKIGLRPGVATLIHQARSQGLILAIATTTTLANVHALITAHFGAEGLSWFAVIGAGDQVAKKKPAPDIYTWVLAQLGLSADDCLAFEDSANGLKSAIGAGLRTVVTPSVYTMKDDFAGAFLLKRDLSDFAW